MHTLTQYHEPLGSLGSDYLQDHFEDFEDLPRYSYNHTDMFHIDPRLYPAAVFDTYGGTQYQRPLDLRRSTSSYDLVAHGFDWRPSRPPQASILPQLDVFDQDRQDIDHFRQLRQDSPSDPHGFTLASNTDSSVSEYPIGPDIIRSAPDLPFPYTGQGMYGTPVTTPPITASVWSPSSAFVPVQLPTSVAAHHTVTSMKDLQVTPDPDPVEHEGEAVDDRDPFQGRINLPVELEISEQLVSPPDSGSDRSLDDDETIKYEEKEEAIVEKDDDSDFRPTTKTSHRRGSTGRRQCLREPRRPRAVIDPGSRVTKPPHTREASYGTPRAKAKKKPPVTKKTGSDSKNFPCAFHHYGCCATFANKNEWKRHVSSQHLQLGYYRCDMGSCSDEQKGFNDFNRKDLFTQHCRRMHAPWLGYGHGEDVVSKKEKDNFEKQLENIRARCWVDRRKAPHKTKCGFCGKKFMDGKESRGWDERMEHVGRHFERGNAKSEDEAVDDGLRQWAIAEGVVIEGRKKGEFWLPGFEPTGATRGPRGQRRSKRHVHDAEVAEAMDSRETNHPNGRREDDDSSDEMEDVIDCKRSAASVQPEDSQEDDDADSASDTDAEAEDDN